MLIRTRIGLDAFQMYIQCAPALCLEADLDRTPSAVNRLRVITAVLPGFLNSNSGSCEEHFQGKERAPAALRVAQSGAVLQGELPGQGTEPSWHWIGDSEKTIVRF